MSQKECFPEEPFCFVFNDQLSNFWGCHDFASSFVFLESHSALPSINLVSKGIRTVPAALCSANAILLHCSVSTKRVDKKSFQCTTRYCVVSAALQPKHVGAAMIGPLAHTFPMPHCICSFPTRAQQSNSARFLTQNLLVVYCTCGFATRMKGGSPPSSPDALLTCGILYVQLRDPNEGGKPFFVTLHCQQKLPDFVLHPQVTCRFYLHSASHHLALFCVRWSCASCTCICISFS